MHLFKITLCAISVGLFSACAPLSPLAKVDLWRTVTQGRDGWQHPEAVIDALAITPGQHVAEIGAGKGYWIPWLSRAVGSEARVYAVEVDSALIEALRQKVAKQELDNVEVVFGTFEDPKLPDGEIDLAITSLTYHHIEERVAYFQNLRRDLSGMGRVAHLDDRDDLPAPVRWLPSRGHWSNVDEMTDEMDQAGYTRVESHAFLPLQSFQIFAPRTPVAHSARPPKTAGR